MGELRFIGRRKLLGEFQQHIYHTLSGQPRILLIEGLTGIGKTRLLAELERIARGQELETYIDSCPETSTELGVPFARLLSHLDYEAMLEAPHGTRLDRRFDMAAQTTPAPTLEKAKQDHVTFLMGFSRTLIRLAQTRPLLVTIDNLHAADQPALDLFEYLAFTLAETRPAALLLVGSHRPVAPESPVGRLLSRLRREPIAHPLALSGFDEAETREFLQHAGVTRPTHQLVQTLVNTTHGIPLFIHEAVHHAERAGALYTRGGFLAVRPDAVAALALPKDISAAIAQRLDDLPADCLDILTLAALVGDAFEADLLEALSHCDRTAIETALHTAAAHGIIESEDTQYRFHHTPFRQGLATRPSRHARQHLHLRIATALEQTGGARLLKIAHHVFEAGPLVDAHTLFHYAERAGHQAFSRFAWRDAARYYETALGVNAPISGRARLHQQAGLSHYRNQDAGPALEHFEQARALCRASGDVTGLAHALIWLVRVRMTHASVSMGALAPYVEELETLLEPLETSNLGLHGHVLTVLAQAYRHARQAQKGIDYAQRALAIGRRVHDDRLCAQAAHALGLTQLGSLQVESAIASWQEALQAARAANDLMLQRLALANLPHAFNLQGSLEASEATALEGRDLTQSLQDWSQRSKALSHLTSIAAARGHYDDATQYARETMAMLERSNYPWGGFRALGALACASAMRGLWAEVNRALDLLLQPGRVFATPGSVVQVFVRVFRQLILGYQGKRLTEYIVPLHDELMAVVAYDTYSLAPLCAMIELGDLTLMPWLTDKSQPHYFLIIP